MSRAIVGVFEDFMTANRVVKELVESGVNRTDITVTATEADATTTTTETTTNATTAGTHHAGGSSVGNFFRSLFGADADEDAGYYAEAVRRGGAMITVNADEAQADRIAETLNRHGAVDMNHRASQFRQSGFTGYDANAANYTAEDVAREREMHRTTQNNTQGEAVLPVVEEELRIGKRAVERGGVRIYNRVTERPVEETVTLREEHVTVERRPVNRAVGESDVANFKEGVLEVTEHAEEAIVDKQARVVEEVVVGKETVSRQETVHDTVRRTDVEVEQLGETNVERARGTSGS